MLWNTNYINIYLSARRNLHYKNVEKMSSTKIDHIGKMYNQEYFEHFKKRVFLRWFSENTENTLSFSKRATKLQKKLNINLSANEQANVNNIEPREFTMHRALKTIEAPYKGLNGSALLMPNIMFFYKNFRSYYKNLNLFELEYQGEIYMSQKEIVLYNREDNVIQKVIKYEDIEAIILKSYCVELDLRNDKKIYFRYKDNELIYISLNRSLAVIKRSVKFEDVSREESDTAERTIESLLNIEKMTTKEEALQVKRKTTIVRKTRAERKN